MLLRFRRDDIRLMVCWSNQEVRVGMEEEEAVGAGWVVGGRGRFMVIVIAFALRVRVCRLMRLRLGVGMGVG